MKDNYSITDVMDELSDNFLRYAATVNSDRAIPDVKSGLKPVARRILFDMYSNKILSNTNYKKSASVVGSTMSRFHPHGDSSIYGALVRLSQPWVMRYPLIDFHGNLGSLGGDAAASMRYTETRLSKLSEKTMLEGLKKKIVDFQPNYSEDETEPVTLPALFPNILCNPNTGIGVSLACNWLPHNLNNVCDTILAYLYDPSLTINDLVTNYLIGPDFPLGGRIINQDNLISCYQNGKGRVTIQARYKTETRGGKTLIVFTEIPFGVNTEDLIQSIDKLYISGTLTGITAVRDESNKKGLRIVIELAKGGNVESVVNKLYHHTNLQKNENFNQVGLVDKTPRLLNLKQVLDIYINHQYANLRREVEFDLAKAQAREHIVKGLLIALEDIDNVIQLIKNSGSAALARKQLEANYGMSETQSKAIVDMKLGRIAGLEKIEIEKEKDSLEHEIAGYINILQSEEQQKTILRTRIVEMKDKFGDDRRTEVTQINITPEEKIKKEIEPENVVVVLTKAGHIKRIPTKSFRIQKRNGLGAKSKDDSVIDIIRTNTIDTLILFSSLGRIFRIMVNDVPEATNAATGTNVASLIKAAAGEEIFAITSVHNKTTAKYALFITEQGMIKKSKIEEYEVGKRNLTGLIATKFKGEDKLVAITFVNEEDLILITKTGMTIKIATKDISPVGRLAMGVKGIRLAEDDKLVAALPVNKLTDSCAIFARSGFAKKIPVKEFTLQGRNGKGIGCYKGEEVVGAAMVDDKDNILILGNLSNIAISAKDIPVSSRLACGTRMIKNSQIISIVKL